MEEVSVTTSVNNENESDRHDTMTKIGLECEDQKKPTEKLTTCSSDGCWDNDQVGLVRDARHDTFRTVGVECKALKTPPEKPPKYLTTGCSNERRDYDQVGLCDAPDDTFVTVGVDCEVLKTPPEQLMTGRTYVHRDDVSDTFEHVGNKVGNTFGKFVLDVDSQK
jgi:hypothetical protein